MQDASHLGLPVHGYRPQSTAAVAQVNQMKQAEERVLRALDNLATSEGIDPRWYAIGRTHIEQGFMAINRAVFKPGRVEVLE